MNFIKVCCGRNDILLLLGVRKLVDEVCENLCEFSKLFSKTLSIYNPLCAVHYVITRHLFHS